MKLTPVAEYLSGSKFSNSLMVRISEPEKKILYRMEFIEELVKGKSVLHMGCADHLELIEEKIRKNIWFHKRLMDCTSRCTGIDINEAAIDFMKSKLGIQDVFSVNVNNEQLPPEIARSHYHYMILGEIIEHIDNPVLFLESIRDKFSHLVDEIIITAPNAFRWNNLKFVFKQTEAINSDHRYWFTPYTLSKILIRSGFHDTDFNMTESYRPGRRPKLKNFLFVRFPALRNTIVSTAKF